MNRPSGFNGDAIAASRLLYTRHLEAWIATGRHLDDDDEAEAFCLAIVMKRPRGGRGAR
jgi:hypothetical protein